MQVQMMAKQIELQLTLRNKNIIKNSRTSLTQDTPAIMPWERGGNHYYELCTCLDLWSISEEEKKRFLKFLHVHLCNAHYSKSSMKFHLGKKKVSWQIYTGVIIDKYFYIYFTHLLLTSCDSQTCT